MQENLEAQTLTVQGLFLTTFYMRLGDVRRGTASFPWWGNLHQAFPLFIEALCWTVLGALELMVRELQW